MTATRRQKATVVTFPKSPVPANSPNIIPSVRQCLIEVLATLQKVSLGGLEDGEKAGHLDGVVAIFDTPPTANTEFDVYHALGRRPKGRFVVGQDGRGELWDFKHKWTAEKIVLMSDRANQEFTLILF